MGPPNFLEPSPRLTSPPRVCCQSILTDFHLIHDRAMSPPSDAVRVDSVCTLCTSSYRYVEPMEMRFNDNPLQNHLSRHSPPVQANEEHPSNVGLPSFSQLLKHVNSGEPSPPRTPNRSNGSTDSSPTGHSTQFGDISWDRDGKRRRLDSTVSDSHYRQLPTETLEYEPRRPSVIDPALSGAYGGAVHQAPVHHHRPSLPFVTQNAPLATHMRHQSSPVPQGHAQYQHHAPPARQSVSVPSSYAPHPSQYDRRPSYYPEPQPPVHGHGYERAQAQTAYYVQQPGYVAHGPYNPHAPPQTYTGYTFQQAHVLDPNSFNRKRRGNLPKEATAVLKKWFQDHRESPYPTEDEKVQLMATCGLTLNQVSNWFINARRRAPGREQRDAREAAERSG
ncbi:hypothetical protein BU23DRAFT_255444 [Bimuria novae-zelandiae CBS 107.79]|uniref:Homeobox domain-containing protein n=1 Tax=Bimuria novae-zelandiae CBS 107.79 TaxID=1447943 RepID=A0A6A5UW21_9PLEO|nr:hypothetical protein BU23DRAFT_255444 [Bimuria novae-zelandiae CBS 107.79]